MAFVNLTKFTVKPTFLDIELGMKEMKEIHDIYEKLSMTQIIIEKGLYSNNHDAFINADKYLNKEEGKDE